MLNPNAAFILAKRVGLTCAIACVAYLQPFRPMVVVGRSMEPTYSNGSVEMTEPARPDQIKAGKVVVIDMDSGPIIKRIAFAPGDRILQAKLDGRWTDLIYVRPIKEGHFERLHWRLFVIPPGMVYVLGDNQEVSYDSKQFGCIPMSRIHRILVDQRPFDIFGTRRYTPSQKS